MAVKMKPSGLFADMMHSIVEFKMMVLNELLECYHQIGEFLSQQHH